MSEQLSEAIIELQTLIGEREAYLDRLNEEKRVLINTLKMLRKDLLKRKVIP